MILDIYVVFVLGENYAPNKATSKSVSMLVEEGHILSDLPRKKLLSLGGITPESLEKLETELKSVVVFKPIKNHYFLC